MDGITSISSVGAVASRFQASAVPAGSASAPAPEPTGVASNALKLIRVALSAGIEAHVLDLKG